MATANNRVKFMYVSGNALPGSVDNDTVYFVAGLQALYVGSALIADHQDLSAFALAEDIPTITVTGSGDDVIGAAYDAATKTLTITKGSLASKYVEVEEGKQLSTEDYTTAEKEKLAGIEAGAQVNRTYTAVASKVSAAQTPAFGGTFNIEDVTQDADGQVATAIRTVTIPDATATSSADGLMSSTDKAALDAIVAEVSGKEDHLENVQADWNQTVTTADDFIKNKPTNVSAFTNDAGYLVAADIDDYTLTKQATADTGYAATYQLFKSGTAVGDKINIPKDMVVSSGTLGTVTVADQPYAGAKVGDKYIDLTLANATSDHVYIPVTDLVDVYTAGNGLTLTNGEFAVDTNVIATKAYAESQALVWQVG